MRLSKAQRAVLEHLARGGMLVRTRGDSDIVVTRADGPRPWTLNAWTTRNLLRRGLIESRGSLYTLTPAGRAALGETEKA